MRVNYIKPSDIGYDYKLSLSPSSCDFDQDILKRYLNITEQVDDSISPFDFEITKIGPSQYIIHLNLTRDVLIESTLNVELGFFKGELEVPITFFPSPFLESIEDSLSTIQTIITIVVGGSFFGTLALGTTACLWSFISFQQFVGYFIYMNIGYPFQVELFLQIIESSFWDFLHNPLSSLTESLAGNLLNPLEVEDEFDPPKKFIKYEKTSFFIENGSTIIMTNLFLLCFLFIVLALKKRTRWDNSLILKTLKVYLRWNIITRTFLENVIPLTLAIFLQIRVLKFNGIYLSLCSSLAILSLVYVCSMTLFIVRILFKRENDLLQFSLIKRIYGTLYEGISLKKSATKYYNIIILFRGLLLIFLISFAEETPLLQIVPLIFANAFIIYYMFKQVSFEDHKFDSIVKVKEILILFGEIGIFLLIAQTKNKQYYQIVGWLIVFFLGLAFLSEFIYMIANQVAGIKKIGKQFLYWKNVIVLYFSTPKPRQKKGNIEVKHRIQTDLSNSNLSLNSNNQT